MGRILELGVFGAPTLADVPGPVAGGPPQEETWLAAESKKGGKW